MFTANCAKCHGTYGEAWTYPNKVVPLAEIGTDPTRHRGIEAAFGAEYSESWFGKEKSGGPPTAGRSGDARLPGPAARRRLGDGPVPAQRLGADAPRRARLPPRPKLFTRSFRTDEADYDKENVGWKVPDLLARPADAALPAIERRKVYDTSQPGRGNAGHTYGDDLTDDDRGGGHGIPQDALM